MRNRRYRSPQTNRRPRFSHRPPSPSHHCVIRWRMRAWRPRSRSAASIAPNNSWADAAANRCRPATGANAQCARLKKMEKSIAVFSSSGPTFDNRQQPVVVAPGQDIISAQSASTQRQSTCRVARLQGTSMATPITADNAALVRQYFTDGFYPTGAKITVNARKPMGALIKAAIVNGARAIDNRDNIGQPLRRVTTPVSPATKGKPDTVQDQGLVTLMHASHS